MEENCLSVYLSLSRWRFQCDSQNKKDKDLTTFYAHKCNNSFAVNENYFP